MSSVFRPLVFTLAVVVFQAAAFAEEQAPPQKKPDSAATENGGKTKQPAPKSAPLDQAALEKKFAEDMSGVIFAGSFSITRDGKETPAEMEKYTITKVSKSKDDYWVFQVRIQYGKHDVQLPLTLQVKWAGDTPMITLTDLTIPGLGTFTSRVLIYGDRYAGTWQHGKVGGHLWGRLEKVEKGAAEKEQPSPSEKEESPKSK